MANKLNIYACSGVGDTNVPAGYTFDTFGTNTLENTQLVNSLLAKINVRQSAVDNLSLLENERSRLLQEISDLKSAFQAAKDASGMTYRLESDNRLKRIFGGNIARLNKVGLPAEARAEFGKVIKRIGAVDESWKNNAELAEYLTKGSEYFLYLYFTQDQLKKLPKVFTRKRDKQQKTYDYCKALFVGVFGSEKDMQDIITGGIYGYFKATPEKVCQEIADGKREAVGEIVWTAALIVKVIIAVLTAVVGIITAICQYAATVNAAKYEAITREDINASVPDQDDFDGLDIGGGKKIKTSYLWIAAAIAGLVWMFKED